MFPRTCHKPESALQTAGRAIRRRGARSDGGICLSVPTPFLAQRVLPARTVFVACTAHIAVGLSWPADPLLAPLGAGPRHQRRWPAADTGNAVPRAF
jgi:hypothetical protein